MSLREVMSAAQVHLFHQLAEHEAEQQSVSGLSEASVARP